MANAHVTVRIEEEIVGEQATQTQQTTSATNPIFGMWQDRQDVENVADYARALRSPRYQVDSSRRQS